MTAADIFCQPNLSPEPFGIVFIEALGHGLPVVTVNMGGAAEIVNSDCGALVSGNADELASALARLIDDPNARRTLGSHGPERARAISDVSRQMASFAKALASITRP